ncbi:MAG: isoprenylcysteine carboxylmethyltransferase family protein [Alphaproteobacteria bacterium]|nr:isoprenylcysteine carboxylmethyltransferase family protein [Alphaproteobacteria bacterium]HPF47454.1 isoprenylcysteine carboxylmethyltransferase family protein [Emcibacteraceae bacterium]HRW29016.1 isoprenylcysteine carboxylmethyltransferase family protein [Emcibacteraceae bacterium]
MNDQQDNAGIITHPPVFYIIAMVIGLGLDYIFPLSFGLAGIEKIAAIVLFILGSIIIVLGFRLFASNKQSPSVHASVSKIYQSGIYAYSRNPIYLGVAIMMLAVGLYLDKLWILIMMIPLIIILNRAVIEKEEAYLEAKFGDEYLNYKNKVRRWI